MSNFNGLTVNSSMGSSANESRVTQAIATASASTGVNFSYLMGQAQIESAMNPNAQASTSSATGLYQFVDQSWLAVLNQHGADHGLSWAANAIQRSASGRYYVADPAQRQQILNLRNQPETASVMAAEMASDNRDYLAQQTGRQPQPVDLYLAHFLGAGGAAKFLNNMGSQPNMAAASLFPAAARANASVFYDQQGNARSLSQIRTNFAQKLASGTELAEAQMNGSGGGASVGGTGDVQPLPADAPMVQPADYVRIEQERLAQSQKFAEKHPYPDYAPRAETARLAYLMLATFGR